MPWPLNDTDGMTLMTVRIKALLRRDWPGRGKHEGVWQPRQQMFPAENALWHTYVEAAQLLQQV